jgi:hypothetical protein
VTGWLLNCWRCRFRVITSLNSLTEHLILPHWSGGYFVEAACGDSPEKPTESVARTPAVGCCCHPTDCSLTGITDIVMECG